MSGGKKNTARFQSEIRKDNVIECSIFIFFFKERSLLVTYEMLLLYFFQSPVTLTLETGPITFPIYKQSLREKGCRMGCTINPLVF